MVLVPRGRKMAFPETEELGLQFLEMWGGLQMAVWVLAADGHWRTSQGPTAQSGLERAVPGEPLAFGVP